MFLGIYVFKEGSNHSIKLLFMALIITWKKVICSSRVFENGDSMVTNLAILNVSTPGVTVERIDWLID